MMTRKRPTIRNVAELAGVSHQTVSRVINDFSGVLPETRAKVEEAIKELDYRPNAIARSMAQGQTCMITCISPNLSDFTNALIVHHAEEQARRRGYIMIATSATTKQEFQDRCEQFIGNKRADALLILDPFSDDRFEDVEFNTPVVYLGSKEYDTCSIMVDNFEGIQKSLQHLYDLGHREIFHITGPLSERATERRLNGYLEKRRELGLAETKDVFEGDWSATSGYQIMKSLIKENRLPTAFCVQNDRMAVGLIHAAREHGIRVPDDLSVTGYDDIPLSSYFVPPLTTVQQDLISLGQEAVDLMLKVINGEITGNKHFKIDTKLIVRQSTKRIDEI